MNRAAAVLLLVCLPCVAMSASDRPPNIVLLIGDDHGYPYFGFMGDENVSTPTMDAIAAGGVTFSHGHVTVPYCRPSLRTMITGLYPVQYQQRLNAHVERQKVDSNFEEMSAEERRMWTSLQKANGMAEFDTLPKLLKKQGYVSWQGGKWWENSYRNGHFDEGMTGGWDLSLYGTDDFFHEMMGSEGNELVRETMDPLFDFIDRQKENPMFIWFGPMLPHTPFDAPYKYRKYYEDKDLSESAKQYYSNISWWDDGVGRLMDYIEEQGLLEDTVFVYLSDNGWEQDPNVEYWRPGVNYFNDSEYATGGYGGKGSLYDLSLRTPIIFYWKDQLGGTFNESSLVSSIDLVPTILDIAGLEVSDDLPGRILTPLLTGHGDYDERTEIVSYSNNRRSRESVMGAAAEGYAVRTHRYHFVWYADSDEVLLYDVTVDPRGQNDLSAAQPEIVAAMKRKVANWKDEIGMTERIDIHE